MVHLAQQFLELVLQQALPLIKLSVVQQLLHLLQVELTIPWLILLLQQQSKCVLRSHLLLGFLLLLYL